MATWLNEIIAELGEAEADLLAANRQADADAAAASDLRDRLREARVLLARMPSHQILCRPVSGRLDASRLALEELDRQALYSRRAADAAAVRVRLLELGRDQLVSLTTRGAADAENVTTLHSMQAA